MGDGPGSNSKLDKRFNDLTIKRASEIPGPGQYDPSIDVNTTG
jgi:hypothetical protein